MDKTATFAHQSVLNEWMTLLYCSKLYVRRLEPLETELPEEKGVSPEGCKTGKGADHKKGSWTNPEAEMVGLLPKLPLFKIKYLM